uniref:Uncharacterized protein n=2 Tax=Oryza sativa subsp. japonica TaxID=39947 RepID=Q69W21_ORYSJ|nr:hypothetical protein [Oryza sativa Japonica Group]BAD30391.1 hypothetical protein [Oryza sativa Japonica Group]BAD32143.1 hypothetical protein [Oryza sativa Japonica Group]
MRRGAVTRGRRRGSNLSGLGPRKRKKRARPESPSASLLVPAPPTRATTNGDGEQSTGGGGNGVEANGRGRERGELGFKGGNVGLGTDLGRSRRELALRLAAKTATEVTPARGKKEENGEEKGGLPLASLGKGGGERGRRGRGRRALPPSLGGLRAERRGRGDDDGDDGGAVWSGAATRATGAAGADDGGDQAVSHHGTRAREATGGVAV